MTSAGHRTVGFSTHQTCTELFCLKSKSYDFKGNRPGIINRAVGHRTMTEKRQELSKMTVWALFDGL